MGKSLSIVGAAVPWALTLLGVPLAPAVAGAVSTGVAIANSVPKAKRKALSRYVASAQLSFATSCRDLGPELGEADREQVGEWLSTRLDSVNNEAALGSVLLGFEHFKSLVGPTPEAWTPDREGFLHGLLVAVHGLVLKCAQSPDVLGVAATAALRQIVAELQNRPTLDQVQRVVMHAVAGQLASRRLILGSRPALAPSFQPRNEMEALRRILEAGDVATVCAVQGMRGLGKSQLASAYAQNCENLKWRFVGWVNAEGRDQLIAELAAMSRQVPELAATDDPEEAARGMVTWLRGIDGDRLLVFDNVNHPGDLVGFVPTGPGMRVIVTTTNHSAAIGTPVEMAAFTLA